MGLLKQLTTVSWLQATRTVLGFRAVPCQQELEGPRMEKNTEKSMENELEAGALEGLCLARSFFCAKALKFCI